MGDHIPRNKLLKICEICIAPEDGSAYLELLNKEYHSQFKELYNRSIIPKIHFMFHHLQQMLDFGPIIYICTVGYEAELRIIKHAA